MGAPLIETERLVLRPHRIGDLDECAAMWADTGVTRFISGRAYSREESWARLLRYAGHWELLNYGFWAMVDRATGRFAGELGFADFQREMEPRVEVPEGGWVVARAFHGRGYGSEAVRAVLAWADARFAKTACLIHPENAASLRLAHNCGYVDRARAVYHGAPTIVLERAAEPFGRELS